MDVNIAELRGVADKLFNHLEETERRVVSIPQDYYWSIPKERLYDPYSAPTDLTLGQLTDDLAELKQIASGESSPMSYALVWMSSIIRAIGESTVD